MPLSSGHGLTMSTIAIVVQTPSTPASISDAEIRRLLNPPLNIGQSPITGEGLLSSSRDQIEINFGPTKINVKDLSGSTEFTKSRIPSILQTVFNWYKTTMVSYGINFIVTVDKADPEVWIKDNLINLALREKTGKELLGGKVAYITLVSEPKKWNIQFAANIEGKLEVNFNASQEAKVLPDAENLRVELTEQYRGFKELLKSLEL